MNKKYYLTTPIYYVNDVPHIGHLSTTLAADFLARYHRLKNYQVFFLTGTDEHGQKVAQAAEQKKLSPQEFTNQVSARFRQAWKELYISNDFFIRTTDPRHKKIASQIIQKIYDQGDIYQDTYEGLYCIGCEKFLTESDLVDGHCPFHPPEKTVSQKETNWFFKLSKYVPQIIELLENKKTNYAFPESKRKEVLAKLKTGVHDISFSRANVEWGVPVPWDKTQTVYVWVEALLNYYTATQFLPRKKNYWPADLHLLGKEIIWFHMVIWQAMLLSAKLPLPKKVFAHSFYIIDEKKISKSLGNMISPRELIDQFGAEGTRYLIASSFPDKNDTNVSLRKFKEKYNADLANNFGNLVSRVAKLTKDLKITNPKIKLNFYPQVENNLKKVDFNKALEFIWLKKIDKLNLILNQEKPWQQKETKAKAILIKIIKEIQLINYNLKPFLPETSSKIEKIFRPGKLTSLPQNPLFPRI
ncbi:MAG: methionine--tRNA ligase [Candidatus Shapirobacteria bacterium]